MMNNNNMLMDWDDAIENDGQEFIILPEGDYIFTVVDFERAASLVVQKSLPVIKPR